MDRGDASREGPGGAELLAGVRAGATGAWEALVRRYEGLVMAVAGQNGLRGEDAADLFQSTWASLYEQLAHIRDPGALPAWILTTARRQAWRAVRHKQRLGAGMADESRDQEPDDAGSSDPLETSIELEQRLLVQECLAEIEERCRTLLRRLYLDRKKPPYEVIASELSLAVGTIGPLRARCLARLLEIAERRGLCG